MAQKDITQKAIEAYNDVFSDIINNLLFDGETVIGENDLEDAKTQSAYKAKDKVVREQDRDVAKVWKANGCDIRIAFLGLENETEPEDDMPFRVIGYDGAAYRDQIRYVTDEAGKRHKEMDRYPVVTLVLYLGYEKRWDKARSIYDVIDEKLDDRLKPFVQDYRINLFEIAYLEEDKVAGFKSDFRILADYLVQMRKNNKYIPSTVEMTHVREVLDMMSVMTNDNRFIEVADEVSKRKEGITMCAVLDEVESRGIAKGQQDTANLYNYLWTNGRGEEAQRASQDNALFNQLLAEYKGQQNK